MQQTCRPATVNATTGRSRTGTTVSATTASPGTTSSLATSSSPAHRSLPHPHTHPTALDKATGKALPPATAMHTHSLGPTAVGAGAGVAKTVGVVTVGAEEGTVTLVVVAVGSVIPVAVVAVAGAVGIVGMGEVVVEGGGGDEAGAATGTRI